MRIDSRSLGRSLASVVGDFSHQLYLDRARVSEGRAQ